MLSGQRTFELPHQSGGFICDLPECFQICRAMQIETWPDMKVRWPHGRSSLPSSASGFIIACKPRTYSGSCAGRTAASSMKATGLAGRTHPVKSDRPDLRTDQTRFVCAGSVTIVAQPSDFLDCKIDNFWRQTNPGMTASAAVMSTPKPFGSFLARPRKFLDDQY